MVGGGFLDQLDVLVVVDLDEGGVFGAVGVLDGAGLLESEEALIPATRPVQVGDVVGDAGHSGDARRLRRMFRDDGWKG